MGIRGVLMGLVVVMFFWSSAICFVNAEVWVYPGAADYLKSAEYRVEVIQNGEAFSSFVYQDANTFSRRLKHMTDFNHWTTFSFENEITVKITKLVGEFSKVNIFPLRHNIIPVVSSNELTFNLSAPTKLWINEEYDYENPLFLFADAPEENVPDKNSPDVVWFGPGVHEIGGQYKVESNKTYYLEGGSYVIGTFQGEKLNNVTIRGRGILSGIDFGRKANRENMHWNLINLSGRGIDQVVEGITFTNPAHFCLLTRGRMHVKNTKMFGWYVQTDGFGGGSGSIIEDAFMKVMDDNVKLYNSNMVVKNMVIYHQRNGSIFQLGWGPNGGNAQNCRISDIDVVTSEATDGQRAFLGFESNNGKTFKNFSFEDIRIDQDIFRLISIHHKQGGYVSQFSFKNVNINGSIKAENELFSPRGTISDISFINVVIGGETVTDSTQFKLKVEGDVSEISF